MRQEHSAITSLSLLVCQETEQKSVHVACRLHWLVVQEDFFVFQYFFCGTNSLIRPLNWNILNVLYEVISLSSSVQLSVSAV